ncbi:MAG: T9SS type A sorting domain-containing protein [Flavobacteriales bacterium]|nr:T9SS type A sorting domain-containing protein [Flavobacteriales bacterium]
MRKILPVLGAALISGVAIAQSSNSQSEVKVWSIDAMAKKATKNVASTKPSLLTPKANYFTEDFEGTTFPPTGWVVSSGTNSTITVPTVQAWHEEANGNPGNCASVLYDNSTDVHDEYLKTPVIDLSNVTSSSLRLTWEFNTSQFWHVTPNDNADITLEVSLDGGATFTDTIWQEDDATLLANSLLDINWETYVWTTAYTDISNLIGQNNVVFAWHYYGQDGARFNMDNVSIDDVNATDLRLIHMFNTDWSNDYEYSMIPLIETRPLAVSAAIINIGGTDLANVGFDYDISQGGSSVASGSATTTIVTQVVGQKDTIYEVSSYTPSAVGTFDMTLTATTTSGADDDASNNSGARTVSMTDTVWAVDNGTIEGSISAGSFADASTYQFEVGNLFLTGSRGGTMASSISFAMADSAQNVGEAVYGIIKEWDGVSWVEIARTDDYALTSADMGAVVTLSIVSPSENILLAPNTAYRVLAGCYGGSEDLDFAEGGEAVEGGVCINIWDGSAQGDFILSGARTAPIVRLNVADLATGIEENTADFTVGQNYPNPFKGSTTINYTLNSADEVMVEITDITGKVIAVMNEGVRAAGNHVVEINSNGLAAGTYYYSVITSNGKVTKAMTVAK